jgi:hypothetical protein
MAEIRVATLHQYWAQLMALGLKRNETRGKRTFYRGYLAIHAAKEIPVEARRAWEYDEKCRAREVLYKAGYQRIDDLPKGAIVGVVEVVDCVTTNAITGYGVGQKLPKPFSDEWWFGNYQPGRWAWITRDAELLEKPVPYRGNQTMHELPDDVWRQVVGQLSGDPRKVV